MAGESDTFLGHALHGGFAHEESMFNAFYTSIDATINTEIVVSMSQKVGAY